jgi:O-antigen ligase
LGNRNFVAHLAAAGLPLLWWLGITARSTLVHVGASAALLVSAAALVLSRTRAAWLAIALWGVALVVVAWRGPALLDAPGLRRRARAAALAGSLGVLGALVLPNTLEWRSERPYLESVRGVVNYREGSGAGRVRQYATSLRIAAAHPVLGVGPGNWPVSYPLFARSDDPSLVEGTWMTANPWPSSDWVAAVSERGVPGATALAATVLLLLGCAWRARHDVTLSADARLAAVAGGSVLFIAAAEGFFDAVLLLAAPALLVWPAAGALLPPARAARELPVSDRTRRVAMAAAAVGGAILVLVTAARLEAMRLYTRGTAAAVEDAARRDPGSYRIRLRAAELWAARGNCVNARRHATAARDLFPKAAAPRAVLARCR